LVRFGLRTADDLRIVNTVKVIDALLKVETPLGPAWHRYNDDGYGEHEDGAPFDGTGTGRAWPLLTGERAHYELAAGRTQEAERLLRSMAAFANEGGMISEQVWDAPDIPEKELFFGRPSGSATPLVWAHAEYIKLLRSLRDGRVFDQECSQAMQRYCIEGTGSRHAIWRFNHKCRSMPAGKTLRVEGLAPGILHWSDDGWQTSKDTEMRDTGLGVFLVDLPTAKLGTETTIRFTFYWPAKKSWEGADFEVRITV
jgi:glucoamylase